MKPLRRYKYHSENEKGPATPCLIGHYNFRFFDGFFMNSSKYHHYRKNRTGRHDNAPDFKNLVHLESTGTESSYLKSLIDSHAKVTVRMKSGEQFHGHIRYYDRYCFSIGLSQGKRKIFLRKDSVSYISEE